MSSSKPLDPVYLIWGEDRAKIETATRRLVARVEREGGMAAERFTAAEAPAVDVVAACETLSFGGARLVIVSEVDTWRASDAEPLVGYLASPNPATCLALIGAKAPPQRLAQAVQAAGTVLHYGMPLKASRADQRRWFVAHLVDDVRAAGSEIGERLAGEVVDRLGGVTDDTREWLALALSTEARKLAAYCAGGPVDREAVEAVVVAHPDAPAYELAEALARGVGAQIHRTLANAAALHDSKASAAALQWSVTRHFRGVAAAQEVGPGVTPADVTRLSGIAGYPAQRVAEHATAMPPGAGARALARLVQLEIDLRVSALVRLGRSRDDGERFAWERAVGDIVADRSRGVAAPDGAQGTGAPG